MVVAQRKTVLWAITLNAIVLLDGVDGVPREIEGQRRKEEKMPEIEIDVIL